MMICFDVFFPLSTTSYCLTLCASHKYIIRNWFSQEEYLLTQFKPGCYHKGITVLIPARDEEQNIGARHH